MSDEQLESLSAEEKVECPWCHREVWARRDLEGELFTFGHPVSMPNVPTTPWCAGGGRVLVGFPMLLDAQKPVASSAATSRGESQREAGNSAAGYHFKGNVFAPPSPEQEQR